MDNGDNPQLQQSGDSAEMLLTASRLLASKLDLSELLGYILHIAPRVMAAERASLYLLDEHSRELYFDIALGLPEELQKIRFKLGEGFAGVAAEQGSTLLVNDAANDLRHSRKVDDKSGYVTRSVLCCPMIIKGHVIGVLQAINHIGGPFTDRDVRTGEALAAQAAVAIENARLFSSLREEKRRLQLFFSTTREGAVLTDPTGVVLLANDAAKAYLPAPQAHKAFVYNLFAEMNMSPSFADILFAKQLVTEFTLERESPKRLYLSGAAIMLHRMDEHNSLQCDGWLWLFRDVTSERTEEKLSRSFLSLVSHKLRTPLTVINGYSQTLANELPPDASVFARKAAATINLQGRKLTALVEQLLSFTALDEIDEHALQKTAIRPAELVEEALSLFENSQADDPAKPRTVRIKLDSADRAALAAAGMAALPAKAHAVLSFSVDCPDSLPEVYGDRALLRKALECLVDNGRKFNDNVDKRISIAVSSSEGKVHFAVTDNGIGIPPEEQERVFGKFYQAENSFTGQTEGWGIGLAFVKKTVEAHGGGVSVRSAPGQGSTFTVSLPVA
jgi:signal transduction histidine kinase